MWEPRRQRCGCPSADKDHVIASGENVGLEQWGLKHGVGWTEPSSPSSEKEKKRGIQTPFFLMWNKVRGAEGESPRNQMAAPFLSDVVAPIEVRRGEVGKDLDHLKVRSCQRLETTTSIPSPPLHII